MCHNRRPRRIAVLVFDGVRTLDVTGPLEVFDVARTIGCAYTVALYSCGTSRSVRCSSGLSFETLSAAELPPEVDTLLIPGATALVNDGVPHDLQQLIRAHAPAVRRVASVCAGAFALGAAGLLEGRRATTHWRHLDTFAARHPTTVVERDSVYTRDGEL